MEPDETGRSPATDAELEAFLGTIGEIGFHVAFATYLAPCIVVMGEDKFCQELCSHAVSAIMAKKLGAAQNGVPTASDNQEADRIGDMCHDLICREVEVYANRN